LNAPCVFLDSLNEALRQKLQKLGLLSDFDLILHLPLRYEDETQLLPISEIAPGKTAQIEAVVAEREVLTRPRRQLVCKLNDDSGTLYIRFFNFYANQVSAWSPGTRLRVLGEVRAGFLGLEMIHPKCRVVRDSMELAKALTPIYPITAGLPQQTLSKLITQAFRRIEGEALLTEIIPANVLATYRLPLLGESLSFLHHPPAGTPIEPLQQRTHPAWRRIKFDELLAQQLSMRFHYQQRRNYQAPVLYQQDDLLKTLLASLLFNLTEAQRRVVAEISQDLTQPHPMQRLLQGDVGSGKTVVAALAALQAIGNGYQAAIMAPTEILAEQHFQKLSTWLGPLSITVAWLSGSQKKSQREQELQKIESGVAMLVIGTHALFQEPVQFNRLGLVIIDEQHRFGVNQRLALRLKGVEEDLVPHQLMMSATPIPRTLSMSHYADMDVSVIDQLPPGRSPVLTKLIDNSRREEVVARIRDACHVGRQAYWVCPLIEESEVLQLKTAVETYESLSQTFPDLKITLIHGRLDSNEKSTIMAAFSRGEVQLLVATTVIEVGVDVPNASLMVIEHAERMGLSQLHQLRGRIGRGADAGICILMYQQPLTEIARKRLQIIFRHTDGFEIARQDLMLRGPGEFLGTRQSGIPMLRFADLEQDVDLLEAARSVADTMLNDYPQAAQCHIQRWLGKKKDYLRV
jgi:ATP-dependent DNA helicase RecG